jgi:hypothetical protein
MFHFLKIQDETVFSGWYCLSIETVKMRKAIDNGIRKRVLIYTAFFLWSSWQNWQQINKQQVCIYLLLYWEGNTLKFWYINRQTMYNAGHCCQLLILDYRRRWRSRMYKCNINMNCSVSGQRNSTNIYNHFCDKLPVYVLRCVLSSISFTLITLFKGEIK